MHLTFSTLCRSVDVVGLSSFILISFKPEKIALDHFVYPIRQFQIQKNEIYCTEKYCFNRDFACTGQTLLSLCVLKVTVRFKEYKDGTRRKMLIILMLNFHY